MVNCPTCDSAIDVDVEDIDEGETLSCDECGATLTVASLDPLELKTEDDAAGEEEDEDFDFDEDEDDDEDEDEEEDEDDDF